MDKTIKKLKIYLDTSVISYLDQQDANEAMETTHKLWDKIKKSEFEVVISNAVTDELDACNDDKKNKLIKYLAQIYYTTIKVDEITIKIASQFVDLGILKQKNFQDCRHIAAEIVGGCDVIVSWNFKHIVNHKTMMGVKAVTALTGYKDLLIYTPAILVGGE